MYKLSNAELRLIKNYPNNYISYIYPPTIPIKLIKLYLFARFIYLIGKFTMDNILYPKCVNNTQYP